jgi:hypothetical protein
VLLKPAQVQLHLPFVPRVKAAQLQVDGDQAPQPAMKEEQVKPVVHPVDRHSLLPRDEGEVRPQLRDEPFQLPQDRLFQVPLVVGVLQAQEVEHVVVAEHQVGAHPVLVPQRLQLLHGDGFGLSRDRRPLKEHPLDLLPERARAPPLGNAHPCVELARQGVRHVDQVRDVRPAQLSSQ